MYTSKPRKVWIRLWARTMDVYQKAAQALDKVLVTTSDQLESPVSIESSRESVEAIAAKSSTLPTTHQPEEVKHWFDGAQKALVRTCPGKPQIEVATMTLSWLPLLL